MKKILLLSCCGLLTAACTTTGDPTAGGIFWSPTKAKVRQSALLAENSAMQSELNSETSKTQSLLAQRERLRAQIAAKKAALMRATTPSEAAVLTREIDDLQRQLAAL